MNLNGRQRWVIAVFVALFVLSALFPPWMNRYDAVVVRGQTPIGYAFIASPPAPIAFGDVKIDVSRLLIEWVVLIVAAVSFVVVVGAQPAGREDD